MVEANKNHELTVSYLPIADNKAVYVDYEMQMPQTDYEQIMENEGLQVSDSKGKFIICCFDKSGSMSGAPFRALKEGAMMIAEKIYSGDNFEGVITMFFDDRCDYDETSSLEEYKAMLDRHQIRGGTSFYPVIRKINEVVDTKPVKDLTVLFFTDGQGSYDQAAIRSLTEALRRKNADGRFLTIGVSQYHDADLLNKISQAGTEIGNFIFIDYSKANYQADIQDSLDQSLGMAIDGGAAFQLVAEKKDFSETKSLKKTDVIPDPVDEDDEEEMKENKPVEPFVPKFKFNLSNTYLKEQWEDINIVVNFKKKPFPNVNVKLVEVKDPSPELRVKAEVHYINRILFEKIQALQQAQGQNTEVMKEAYDEIKQLDVRLDDIHSGTFKIKNKMQRKELVQVIQECKERTKNAVSIVRACIDSGRNIDNASIAKLNDLAFKGIK